MIELYCEGRCGRVALLNTADPDFWTQVDQAWQDHRCQSHGPGADPVFLGILLAVAGAALTLLWLLAHA